MDYHLVVCWAEQLVVVLVDMTVEWWVKLTASVMVESKAVPMVLHLDYWMVGLLAVLKVEKMVEMKAEMMVVMMAVLLVLQKG